MTEQEKIETSEQVSWIEEADWEDYYNQPLFQSVHSSECCCNYCDPWYEP